MEPNQPFNPNQPSQPVVPTPQPAPQVIPPQQTVGQMPQVGAQPPYGQPLAQPQPYQQPYAQMGANSLPRSRKPKMIIAIVLVIIAVIAIALVFVLKKPASKTASNSAAQSSQQASQLGLLKQYGANLKASDLNKFDKTALFFTVFKNAAMQQEVSALTDEYEGGSSTDQSTRRLEYITQAYYNYATKKEAMYQTNPAGTYATQCIGSHSYRYSDINGWVPDPTSDANSCDVLSYGQVINDGVNTGGLNAAQAQTFISTIENATGLISVHDMSYVTHAGAPYIRLLVTVDPVVTPNGHQGMGVIGAAFDKTGLNAQTWPYDNNGGNADGIEMIYYINPATQLPAYSQTVQTYYIDDSTGKHVPVPAPYTPKDTEYTFGGTIPDALISAGPHVQKLSWPEEKM